MEQLLKLLMLLSGSRAYTLREIAARFNKSERTVFRQLNALENAGFVLERTEDPGGMRYRLTDHHPENKSIRKLLHFSENEALLIYQLLSELDGNTALKEQLLKKLHTLYDTKIISQFQNTFEIQRIRELSKAIDLKKQVTLKAYRSSNSGTTLDRRVEPFRYLEDYKAIWCFDLEDKKVKQFKISRMEDVAVLSAGWENAENHIIPFVDIFQMSAAKPIATIEARLTLKAYNLLLEGHPAAAHYVKNEESSYYLKVPVADFNGIGRFVLGLPGEIELIESQKFKDFIQEKRKLKYD